jgi:hypothetical protein
MRTAAAANNHERRLQCRTRFYRDSLANRKALSGRARLDPFLDAWETQGDGSPGYTMAKANPSAAPPLLPNLRWD